MPLIGAAILIVTLTIIIINLYNDKKTLTDTIKQLDITTQEQINNLTNENIQLKSKIEILTRDNEQLKQECDKLAYELEEKNTTAQYSNTYYSASTFKKLGIVSYNGYQWTWYSQKVLPGHGLKIPGRHVDENNYVCDENNYICLASSTLPKGTVMSTPFGKYGKVYDCGCPVGITDVYVDW